jgi:putative membrane protein
MQPALTGRDRKAHTARAEATGAVEAAVTAADQPVAVSSEPDVRFTLANERTFLSWIRTALALIGGGVAVARLLADAGPPGMSIAAGVALVGLGALVATSAYRRWQMTDAAIRADQPIPPSAMPMVLSGAVFIGALLAVALIALTTL